MIVIMMTLLAATFIVLIIGIGFMIKGGEGNLKYSNRLMTARVILQGLTIAVLGLMFVFSGG